MKFSVFIFNLFIVSAKLCVSKFHNIDASKLGETQVLRSFPATLSELLFLNSLKQNLAYDFWLHPRQVDLPVDIMAGGRDLEELKSILEFQNINYTIFMADVPALTKRVLEANEEAKKKIAEGCGNFFESYHTYEEIVKWMRKLEQHYPNKVQLLKLGRSYEFREMYALKLSRPSFHRDKPAIWIDGGVHAREWISPAVVTYMLNELLTNEVYEPLLGQIDFYFLPVMNPDGYDYTFTQNGRLWRKTRSKTKSLKGCLGVDLNRNWNFHWNNTAPENRKPCSDTYAGEEPFSEKEAFHAKQKMISTIWNLRGYLTYHSYAQLWLFPWGYTTDFVTDLADMEKVSSDAVDALYSYSGTRYKQQPYCVESDLCVYGNSIDYFRGMTKLKYCFLIQLPDLGNYGYLLPPSEIIPTGQESLRGLLVVVNAILNDK